LRGAGSGIGDDPALEKPRSKPALEQLEDLAVDHPSLDLSHEGVPVDLVKGVGDTLPTSGTFRKRCASCDPTILSRARISSS
jgi:hypothetical protein